MNKRDVWAGLQPSESLNPKESLHLYHPGGQQFGQPSITLKDCWIPGTISMGQSSKSLFTSRGAPMSPDLSGGSEPEDGCSNIQIEKGQSRYCPCCYRIFTRDLYLFGHLKRSKCRVLCGERGCERLIKGIHEVLMCQHSKHRFHCQKCRRHFGSWRWYQRHLFCSRDCSTNRGYNAKGLGGAKPQQTAYSIPVSSVSQSAADISASEVDHTGGAKNPTVTEVQVSQGAISLTRSNVDITPAFNLFDDPKSGRDSPNDGRFGVQEFREIIWLARLT